MGRRLGGTQYNMGVGKTHPPVMGSFETGGICAQLNCT